MLRALGVVLSIGLADSLNPSTVAPALYLATGESAVADLLRFTAGVFVVYLLGGAVIVAGPGAAILALVPHPSATTRYILELVAGVAMLIAAAYLWRRRERLGARRQQETRRRAGSGLLLGATISAVELPTAFPYFAAIAAIVGSGIGFTRQLILLVIYNACFVLPLLAIAAMIALAGDRGLQLLNRIRNSLRRRWPTLLAAVALAAGLFVLALGATGLAEAGHGTVARFSRHLRKVIAR